MLRLFILELILKNSLLDSFFVHLDEFLTHDFPSGIFWQLVQEPDTANEVLYLGTSALDMLHHLRQQTHFKSL